MKWKLLRYWGYIGIMENKMDTTIVYRGYVGIMENKLGTTRRGRESKDLD